MAPLGYFDHGGVSLWVWTVKNAWVRGRHGQGLEPCLMAVEKWYRQSRGELEFWSFILWNPPVNELLISLVDSEIIEPFGKSKPRKCTISGMGTGAVHKQSAPWLQSSPEDYWYDAGKNIERFLEDRDEEIQKLLKAVDMKSLLTKIS